VAPRRSGRGRTGRCLGERFHCTAWGCR
jgi:hypothetical protein